MIPQTNARITLVRARGTEDDWNTPGGPGAQKWAGSLPAYYREVRERRTGDAPTVVLRSLIVQNDQPPVQFERGDVVELTYAGAAITGTVRMVERRAIDSSSGVPPEVQTTRLTFEET